MGWPAIIGAIAQGGGQMGSGFYNMYSDLENLKLNRRALANDETNSRFVRLLKMIEQSQSLPQTSAGLSRLHAIRNSGRTA